MTLGQGGPTGPEAGEAHMQCWLSVLLGTRRLRASRSEVPAAVMVLVPHDSVPLSLPESLCCK